MIPIPASGSSTRYMWSRTPRFAIDITADGVDFEKAGASINPSTHNLEFKGHFWVKSGYVDIYPKTSGVDIQEIQLPKELTLNASFSLDGFDIKSVSGRIHPDFAGLGIEPIPLAGIPDSLKILPRT